jgi:CheY-like chemotaxis protein
MLDAEHAGIEVMKKKVIAIFEDDQVSRFIYERIFQDRNDIQLHIFDNPEKGLALAANIRLDIIFIELHFWENFGGVNILNKLKETSAQHTKFVAISAFLQKGDQEHILRSGFHLCIEKPAIFSSADIFNLMNKLADSPDPVTDLPAR